MSLAHSRGIYLDRSAHMWGLRRTVGESDDDLRTRVLELVERWQLEHDQYCQYAAPPLATLTPSQAEGQDLEMWASLWGLSREPGESDGDLQIRVRERIRRPLSVGPGEQDADGGYVVTSEQHRDICQGIHDRYSELFSRESVRRVERAFSFTSTPAEREAFMGDVGLSRQELASGDDLRVTATVEPSTQLVSMPDHVTVVPGSLDIQEALLAYREHRDETRRQAFVVSGFYSGPVHEIHWTANQGLSHSPPCIFPARACTCPLARGQDTVIGIDLAADASDHVAVFDPPTPPQDDWELPEGAIVDPGHDAVASEAAASTAFNAPDAADRPEPVPIYGRSREAERPLANLSWDEFMRQSAALIGECRDGPESPCPNYCVGVTCETCNPTDPGPSCSNCNGSGFLCRCVTERNVLPVTCRCGHFFFLRSRSDPCPECGATSEPCPDCSGQGCTTCNPAPPADPEPPGVMPDLEPPEEIPIEPNSIVYREGGPEPEPDPTFISNGSSIGWNDFAESPDPEPPSDDCDCGSTEDHLHMLSCSIWRRDNVARLPRICAGCGRGPWVFEGQCVDCADEPSCGDPGEPR